MPCAGEPLISTSDLALGLDPVLKGLTIEAASLFVELIRPLGDPVVNGRLL